MILLLAYVTLGLILMEWFMPKFDFWDMLGWAFLWPLIIVLGIYYCYKIREDFKEDIWLE